MASQKSSFSIIPVMKGLINEIRKIKTREKNIAANNTKKLVIYNKKWKKHTEQ